MTTPSLSRQPSPVGGPPAVPSREEFRTLLLARDFSALNTLYAGLHAAHAEGRLSERALEQAYNGATSYREELTAPLREWAGTAPRLYPAQVAWGVHLLAQALKLRTMRLAKDIPQDRLDAMFGALMAAQAQLQDALELDAQATLAYASLMWIQTQQGERAWPLYLEGLKRAPASMVLRQAMLGNLRTEWGGSQIAQDGFLERPEHDDLLPEGRAELRAIHQCQLGHYRTYFLQDRAGAREAYRAALEAHPRAAALGGLAALSGTFAKRRLQAQAVELAPDDLHYRATKALGRIETWAPAGPELAILRECAAWGEPFAADIVSAPVWVMRLRPWILRFARR